MNQEAQAELKNFQPKHEYFVGIDSDGCAFNTMEVKHNDCFSVNLIKHFGLPAISRQVHQAWDFVNLYSKTRGCNRFRAILSVCDFLREMPKVQRAGVSIPEFPYLREWVETETQLGNPKLKEAVENATKTTRDELSKVLQWSLAVNETIAEIVHNLPPFPGVRETLQQLEGRADVIVVSATPHEALTREWAEHNIDQYVAVIAGQEMGSKTEHLTLTAKGKYAPNHVLMIGDAPGDLKAARDVGALFFPVNPGYEEESWERLVNEGMDRFFNNEYAGDYEAKLIEEFDALLPEEPPWKTGDT
ncbi:MAG: HAD hydrolase-like protein [Candidatus Poribacteria bacterium]|nr:HAD hydrolase-like protein [Candidatus Poribacteria bacterium]